MTPEHSKPVAGTEAAVLMVESEANELPEEVMLGAVTFGHEQMQIAIKAINELAAEAGKPKWSWVAPEPNKELQSAVSGFAETAVAAAYTLTEKMERYAKIKEIKAAAVEALAKGETPKFTAEQVGAEFSNLEYRLVRGKILDGQPRIDARKATFLASARSWPNAPSKKAAPTISPPTAARTIDQRKERVHAEPRRTRKDSARPVNRPGAKSFCARSWSG